MSKGESCDANDHLTIMLPRGGIFTVQSVYDVQKIAVIGEDIIDLRAREIVN